MSKKVIYGLNVQWPWSQLIASGKKQIETRSYPIPQKHIGKPLAIIETPGKKGRASGIRNARIVGVVIFSGCFRYSSKAHWIKDASKHLVDGSDPQFAFDHKKEKWAWTIEKVTPLKQPVVPPKSRGIVFAKNCVV